MAKVISEHLYKLCSFCGNCEKQDDPLCKLGDDPLCGLRDVQDQDISRLMSNNNHLCPIFPYCQDCLFLHAFIYKLGLSWTNFWRDKIEPDKIGLNVIDFQENVMKGVLNGLNISEGCEFGW